MTNKLKTLTEDWGYSEPEAMVEDYLFDGVMPAICVNDDCDYTTEMEPDQDRGWCDCCHTNTVQSASILMGII
ncbi:hypothetical protein N9Y00_07105 [Tateyamaria sp.]|nr:hypothetical protein [Tateyamaria sp.]